MRLHITIFTKRYDTAHSFTIMKFRILHIISAASVVALALSSCEDNANTIGSSLTGDNVEILVDSSFTISGNTYRISSIEPKTNHQLIGSVSIPGYGTLSSDVVTQFLPSTMLDTKNFKASDVDSVSLRLTYFPYNIYGDSVAPLGITVYPLNKLLPNDIKSDFDPNGYYTTSPLGSSIYNASSINDSITEKLNYREINVKLPVELGQDIFQAYIDNSKNFLNGQVFSENVFPGVYIRNSFGSGRLTNVSATGVSFYFTKITTEEEKTDTTVSEHQYMLATPEIISNNIIKYNMDPSLEAKLNAGDDIFVAPVGTESEFTFPIKEVIDVFKTRGGKQAVINSLSMQIPVDSLVSGVTPPPYVLLILKKDREAFFDNNKLPDNKTSFYAEYNSTTGSYNFSGLRYYFSEMLDKTEIKAEDYTFQFIPVQVSFEELVNSGYYSSTTQYTESEVQPYALSPVLGQLHFDKAKIKLIFSRLQANQ